MGTLALIRGRPAAAVAAGGIVVRVGGRVSKLRPQALVVGGAKRVGRAISIALAKAGCDVVVTYRKSARDVMDTLKVMEDFGGTHQAVSWELEDLDAVSAESGRLAASKPNWDVLVYSASTYESCPLTELSPARLQRDMNVNALAPAIMTQKFAPHMQNSKLPGGAAIVAMIDIHAMGRPRKDFLSYSMSKAALGEMVQSLARDLAPKIRVNGVAPGVVAWPESGQDSDLKMQAQYLSRVPLQRAGTPEDAAEVVRWLALDAQYVTGQIVRVDGGRWLN